MVPARFRRLNITERVSLLEREYGYSAAPPSLAHADRMIESAIGFKPVPLGIVPRVLVNKTWYQVPMATEEPSVVKAQTFAAGIIARHGGVESHSAAAIGTGQVFIEKCTRAVYRRIAHLRDALEAIINARCASLAARGGGFVVSRLYRQRYRYGQKSETMALFEFDIDTVDAMGANRIIAIAEEVASWLKSHIGCNVLMAILSNDLDATLCHAQFTLPITALKSLADNSKQLAEKIVRAGAIAIENEKRAVTHNKGIMNGITALAIATANDTRAVEAAAHKYAATDGHYRALSRYRIEDACLKGKITLPLPFATVGGATEAQQDTKTIFSILNISSASELRMLAAAIGLQQNFAALLALVQQGISHGHMPLQQQRITMP